MQLRRLQGNVSSLSIGSAFARGTPCRVKPVGFVNMG